jgi:hypothetical protein
LREAEKWDGQVTVGLRLMPTYTPIVWGEIEMFHVEASRKSPFVYLVLSRVDVLIVSGFVLEPVVKPGTDDGDAVR